MSKQHTPGPLTVWPDRNRRLNIGPSPNYTVAEMFVTPGQEQEANARRLAACWNAFEKFPTVAIEKLIEIGGVASLCECVCNDNTERDELLEALEKLVKAVDFTEVKAPNPLTTLGRALRQARAALAKATGSEA